MLFDTVAELYESTRRGYPTELVEFMLERSASRAGAPVLEVGCGTGQLTRQLARYDLELTAIDIGPAMIAMARRHVLSGAVHFEVTSFETLDVPDHAFGLVVSATAFHWIDPEVAWTKVARLLRPDGWLALLGTRERYDEPLGSAIQDLWIDHSDDGGAWAREPKASLGDVMAETGLFAPAMARSHSEPLTLDSPTVFGLEHTRATSLGYDEMTRRSFTAKLESLLERWPQVGLRQETVLTMAQVADGGER